MDVTFRDASEPSRACRSAPGAWRRPRTGQSGWQPRSAPQARADVSRLARARRESRSEPPGGAASPPQARRKSLKLAGWGPREPPGVGPEPRGSWARPRDGSSSPVISFSAQQTETPSAQPVRACSVGFFHPLLSPAAAVQLLLGLKSWIPGFSNLNSEAIAFLDSPRSRGRGAQMEPGPVPMRPTSQAGLSKDGALAASLNSSPYCNT